MNTWEFSFTTEDLAANRQGKLSPQQEQLVASLYHARQRTGRLTVIAYFLFFALLIVISAAVEFNESQRTLQEFIFGIGSVFIMVIGVLSIPVAMSSFFNFIAGRETRQRKIRVAEGTAFVYTGETYIRTRKYMLYQLTLKNGRHRTGFFRLKSEAELRHFTTGKNYRLYYMKFHPLPVLLSTEEI